MKHTGQGELFVPVGAGYGTQGDLLDLLAADPFDPWAGTEDDDGGISDTEWDQIEQLARGGAVPGGPGACAGCGHGKVWHNPRNRVRECERCECKGYAR